MQEAIKKKDLELCRKLAKTEKLYESFVTYAALANSVELMNFFVKDLKLKPQEKSLVYSISSECYDAVFYLLEMKETLDIGVLLQRLPNGDINPSESVKSQFAKYSITFSDERFDNLYNLIFSFAEKQKHKFTSDNLASMFIRYREHKCEANLNAIDSAINMGITGKLYYSYVRDILKMERFDWLDKLDIQEVKRESFPDFTMVRPHEKMLTWMKGRNNYSQNFFFIRRGEETEEKLIQCAGEGIEHCKGQIECIKKDRKKYHAKQKRLAEGVTSVKLLARCLKLPENWRIFIYRRLNDEKDWDDKDFCSLMGQLNEDKKDVIEFLEKFLTILKEVEEAQG